MKSASSLLPLPTWLYIAGWVFFVYLFWQILWFDVATNTNILVGGMYFVQFGIHEASHLAVMFLPSLLVALAGSVGEIAFTSLILFACIKYKSYFAAIFASLWLMLALRSVGRYMADARAQAMPLIGPGESVQHDWAYLFGQLGWLQADTIIGGITQGVGVLIGTAALLAGAAMIFWKMYQKA